MTGKLIGVRALAGGKVRKGAGRAPTALLGRGGDGGGHGKGTLNPIEGTE
jgi:hypothetical protein